MAVLLLIPLASSVAATQQGKEEEAVVKVLE
jgi:hypothetical protein